MAYVLLVLLLFAASVTVHVLFCRSRRAEGLHARAFILIALFFMAVYAVLVYLALHKSLLDPGTFWGTPLIFTAGLMYALLVPIYLSFYVLTQLMSPSKKILLALTRDGPLPYDGILESIRQEDFINTRLNDLITSGCVVQKQDRYVLSASGRRVAGVLDLMQWVLGRDKGG